MANKQNKSSSDVRLAVLFIILAFGVILFFGSTDIFTLFSVTGLTLDASNSRASPSERGADGLTGQFRAEANLADFIERFRDRIDDFLNQIENRRVQFERPSPQNPPMCRMGACSQDPPVDVPVPPDIPPFIQDPSPPPIIVETIEHGTTVTVIDFRTGATDEFGLVNGEKGGGVLSSSAPIGGVPELIRNNVVVHERFHTLANGQSTTGSILLEWGHGESITVQQFLVPNEYFDWFEFELPQTIRGDGVSTFDGVSEGEFFYKLTIPEDLINKDTVIPIRMIINTQDSVVDAVTEIQIERPVQESEKFSVAELFRSIFTEVRQIFA